MYWCYIVFFFQFRGDASSSKGEINPPKSEVQFAYRILVGGREECFSQVIYRAFA